MVQPRIQYAVTKDGTEIAFTVVGSGPWLVVADFFLASGLDYRLTGGAGREIYPVLARNRSLVLFDWRGSGLSGPAVHFDLDSLVDDIASVVDQLNITSFDLLGFASPCHVALEYAARFPRSVRRLVLGNPAPKGGGGRLGGLLAGIANVAAVDWHAFTELYGLWRAGWTDAGRVAAEQFRKHWTAQSFDEFMVAVERLDTFARAADVACDTLVVVDDPARRRLAAIFPRGQLAVVPGGFLEPTGLEAIEAFLGHEEVLAEPAHLGHQTGAFRTILFTDIEGHTGMMQRLGDAKGREVLREHERLTREALAANGGTEVKTMGDGFLASFGSAQKAMECAVALQKAFAGQTGQDAVRIRIGVNAGEPIAEDDDLFGASVIAAARIAAKAVGGEVLVSDVVRQLVAGKGFLFGERGEEVLRGFDDPVRLWELRWQPAANAT